MAVRRSPTASRFGLVCTSGMATIGILQDLRAPRVAGRQSGRDHTVSGERLSAAAHPMRAENPDVLRNWASASSE